MVYIIFPPSRKIHLNIIFFATNYSFPLIFCLLYIIYKLLGNILINNLKHLKIILLKQFKDFLWFFSFCSFLFFISFNFWISSHLNLKYIAKFLIFSLIYFLKYIFKNVVYRFITLILKFYFFFSYWQKFIWKLKIYD